MHDPSPAIFYSNEYF